MFASRLTITGGGMGILSRRPMPLIDVLCPNGASAPTESHAQRPTIYQRITTGYADVKAQVQEVTAGYTLLPTSHRQPTNRLYEFVSPWREPLADQLTPAQSANGKPARVKGVGGKAIPNPTSEEWTTYARYLKHYWRPYWPLGLVSGGLMMGMGLYGAFYAATLKTLLDAILVASGSAVVVPTLIKLLVGLPIAFGATVGGAWLASRVSARIANDLRYDLLAHLQSHSVAYFKENKLGDLLSHFAGDLPDIERGMTRVLLRIATGAATVLLLMLLLFWMEWHLALYVLVVLPMVTYLLQKSARYVTKALRAQRNRDGLTISTVEETLRAQPMIQSFGIRQLIQDSYWAELRKLEKASAKSGLALGFLVRSSDAGTILVDVSTISLGILLMMAGMTSITTLVAFQALSVTLRREFTTAVNDSQLALQSVASIGRIDRLFQQTPTLCDAPNALELPPFRHAIHFEGVSFSYNGHETQLDQINLTIAAGRFVAFVGPSGAGKSTLLNLLLRFYDVSAGRITVDGHDIRDVTQASLRANMGVVLQDTFLFNSTIFDNIQVVKPTANEADVIAAAKAAELHDFIMSLPDGYQTNVGEGGGKLSGGQKQRVAIARAMLVDPAILLLDEATSSLDADTAAAINATIQKIAKTRTVIAITHYLSAVVDADQIYVLQQGNVVEEGDHETLLDRNGLYAQLWNTQNGSTNGISTSSTIGNPV